MDLSALRTKLRRKVGNPSTTDVSNTILDDLINDALQEIQEKYPFLKGRKIVTFPTVASSSLYDIPTDCLAVYSIWNTTEDYQRKLLRRDENWLAAQQSQTNNAPVYYVRQRGWIQLVPTPDAVYTLRLMYRAEWTTLTADTDVPAIPTSWHPGIWRKARFLYWDEKGDFAKAQWAHNAWNQWVEDKPDELEEEQQMDDTQGVSMPFLSRGDMEPSAYSSQLQWDRA